MKNYLSRKFSLAICSAAMCTTPFALTSCGNSHSIQFANFESYMDPGLMRYIQDQYDVQYQWFTVTEMIETKFHRTYDIAVPSGYELSKLQKKGWLEKIDWSKLIPDTNSSNDVIDLFAPPIQKTIKAMNERFGINVLDYGVPYFAQSFTFIYKGSELTFYKNGTTTPTSTPDWSDIFYTIGPRNPKLDERFNNRIGMVDDSKSLFDISRIIQTIEENPTDPSKWSNEMPAYDDIDDLVNIYKRITSKAKKNWYTLNTDSGVIARNLADHSNHGYVGALSWSGDALYAAQGAGEFDPYTGEEMHVMKPYGASLDEMEFLVINNKNHSNPDKLDRIYKLIYDVCLDSYNVTDQTELLKEVEDKYTEDKRYKYWSMQNWNTVNYVPTLNSIYSQVTQTSCRYWDYAEDESSKKLYTSLVTMTNPDYANSLFGLPLTNLQNSDTHWAWLQSRVKL